MALFELPPGGSVFALQIKLDADKLKGQEKDDAAKAEEKPKAKKPAKGSKS